VVTLSKVTKLGHPLAGLPLPLLNNLVMAMHSLEHTLVQLPSTMCLSKLMQVILPTQLVDILPIGTSPLQLPSSLPMIIIINSLSNSRILVVLHLQLMGLLTITINHHPLVITNRGRYILRMAMVHINNHHNQGMLSQHHMISSKSMAQPQAMGQLKRAKLPPTMDQKGIQPKFHLSNLHNKVMVAANSLAQMLPTIHHKGLLSQVMGYRQPPKQHMAANLKHSLVMDPLKLKSQVVLRLHTDNHSHLMLLEVMVNLGILLPSPLLLDIPNQKQALKEPHLLVMVLHHMVLRHMVLLQAVNLVMVRHHMVPMVLVILRPQHILLMVMQVGMPVVVAMMEHLHRELSRLVLLSHLRADVLIC
jgi:hypothetical protein